MDLPSVVERYFLYAPLEGAEIVEVNGQGRDHTEWQVPERIYELADTYGGEVRDVACYPKGRSSG